MATEDRLFEKSLDKLVALNDLYGFEFEGPGSPPLVWRRSQRNYKWPERRLWWRNSSKLRWMLTSRNGKYANEIFKIIGIKAIVGIQDYGSWNDARRVFVTSFSADGTIMTSCLSKAQLSKVGTSSRRFALPFDPWLGVHLWDWNDVPSLTRRGLSPVRAWPACVYFINL